VFNIETLEAKNGTPGQAELIGLKCFLKNSIAGFTIGIIKLLTYGHGESINFNYNLTAASVLMIPLKGQLWESAPLNEGG
jgi:hypothetical protein